MGISGTNIHILSTRGNSDISLKKETSLSFFEIKLLHITFFVFQATSRLDMYAEKLSNAVKPDFKPHIVREGDKNQ